MVLAAAVEEVLLSTDYDGELMASDANVNQVGRRWVHIMWIVGEVSGKLLKALRWFASLKLCQRLVYYKLLQDSLISFFFQDR